MHRKHYSKVMNEISLHVYLYEPSYKLVPINEIEYTTALGNSSISFETRYAQVDRVIQPWECHHFQEEY